MKKVSLYEAKTHLSALADEAAAGEEIVISKNGKPRAKLVALEARPATPKREFGFWEHYGWKLPSDFDDNDPEIEAMFHDGLVFKDDGPIFPDDKA